MPADGGIIEVAENVVGRVMETGRGRTLRVDPVAAVGVPGPGVGVVTAAIQLGSAIELHTELLTTTLM